MGPGFEPLRVYEVRRFVARQGGGLFCIRAIAFTILYTHFFTPKNPSSLHNLRYLIEHKHLTTEGFAAQTLQQPVTNYTPPFCLPYPSASNYKADIFCFARDNFHCLPDIFHYLRRKSLLQTC